MLGRERDDEIAMGPVFAPDGRRLLLQPSSDGATPCAWAARGEAAAQPRAIMASRDKASRFFSEFMAETT
jgi:hypothetical protein